MLDFMLAGGPFMWPIFGFFIISCAVIFEKLYTLFWRQKSLKAAFSHQLYDAISRADFAAAAELSAQQNNALAALCARICRARAAAAQNGCKASGHIYPAAATAEARALYRGEFLLSAAVAICPQLGLLGTVWGLIGSFGALAAEQGAAVAGGIAQALYTTAFGLFVAIFALVFHVIFEQRFERLEDEILQFASTLERIDAL